MYPQPLGNLFTHRHRRIEAGHWILEDHADRTPPVLPRPPAGPSRRSLPSNNTLPPAYSPGGWGMRRIIERAVTLFPQPLSPTIPTFSPGLIAKLTPSTARTFPAFTL